MNMVSTSPQAEGANGLGSHEWGEGVGTGPCLGMEVSRTTFLELF